MTDIYSECGLTGAGTPHCVTTTTGTYILKTGASSAPDGGIHYSITTPTWQIDGQNGNMALGAGINFIAGTPPSINATGGTALCAGGCPFQWGSTSAIITANHALDVTEGTAPAGAAGVDRCYADSTAHAVKCSYNNGTFFNVPQVIGSGTATMTTAAIGAGACGTTVTVGATGVATTDTITTAFNAAPAGTNAGLTAWPTANNVNFAYCPGVAETPAAATINWRVVR
jgi:hypothetical protein